MLVILVVFTACLGVWLNGTRAEKRLPEDKVPISLAIGYSVKWMGVFQGLCDEFNEQNPDVYARVVGIPGRYYTKILMRTAAGTAPDVMWMGMGFPRYASRGAFLDVEDHFEFDPEEYYTQVVDLYRYKGRLYGAPYCGDFNVMAYNKDIFREEGVDEPSDDWTAEDFRRIAKQLTKRDEHGRTVRWGSYGSIDAGAFGAFHLNESATRGRLDEPQWVEYFKYVLALRFEDRSTPDASGGTQQGQITPQEAFLRQTTAILARNIYTLPDLREQAADFEWDIAPMPRAVRRSCGASTQGFTVSSQTKHPEEAIRLLKHLVSPDAQYQMRELGLPTHKATARRVATEWPAPPSRGDVMLQSIEYINPFPRVPRIDALQRAFNDMFARIIARKIEPEEALKRCNERFNEILSR